MPKKQTVTAHKPSRSASNEAAPKPRSLTSAFRDLSAYYRFGEELNRELAKCSSQADRTSLIGERAGERKITKNDVTMAVQFTEKYSPDDVRRLAALRAPDGRKPNPGLLRAFLAIDDRSKRKVFEKRAVLNGWSQRQAIWQYKLQFGEPGKRKGRPPRQPKSKVEALLRLSDECQRWLHWYGKVDPELWPQPLKAKLIETAKQLEGIKDSAGHFLAKCRTREKSNA